MNKFTSLIENLRGVPLAMWATLATILLFVVNAVLTAFSINPIILSDDQVFKFVSYAAALCSIAYLGWKNFDFTDKARAAGQILTLLQQGYVTVTTILKYAEEIKNTNNSTTQNNIETAQNASGTESGGK
ncbi:phage holin [Acetobacterium sp.]|uniref:phage holin n=1 Tax=Acetobacterium sp. TaxID=1872094 RepID=UPI002F42A48C